ncbi:MAG TPA: DUF1634 domain-containing protein [Acidobacteriaceae bacterium]|nr:DUF1634 domain-containing protein [Acidobacteriaceae bacterium]
MTHSDGAAKMVDGRAQQDARMELVMGRLLQAGVLLAALTVLVGGVVYLLGHAWERVSYRVFQARPIEVRHPAALLHRVVTGDAVAAIELGILLLVATPVCRVVFAVIAFALERDRLYVAVSVVVLGVLLSGLLRSH